MLRHLALYPLNPLCGASNSPIVTTCEEADVDCPECRRLRHTVRWTGVGWVLRETPSPVDHNHSRDGIDR